MYDANLPYNVKLASIIQNSAWDWLLARSDGLVDIQAQTCDINLDSAVEDLAIWLFLL